MKQPPLITIQLIHIFGPLKGQIQEFPGPVVSIGRHPQCHLRFPPEVATVSRKHAEIVREGNQFKLVDHSANGTFVNGKQVKEATLKDGDVLEFAKGGPKVSFLAQMREDRAGKEAPPAPPAEPPGVVPSREPEAEISARPLIIQYGPTLRSFKQLPVTIGKNPACEFKLDLPSILDRHAQIFFAQNQYWVKDLTGMGSLRLNGQPMPLQAPLNTGSQISLSPHGPVFRFLGEGRLAEVSPPADETPPAPIGKKDSSPQPEGKNPEGLFSKVKKIFDA